MIRSLPPLAFALVFTVGCAPEPEPAADQVALDRDESAAVLGDPRTAPSEKREPETYRPGADDAAAFRLYEDPGADRPVAASRLMVVLDPTEGHAAHGTLAFTRTDKGLRLEGELSGLPPDSTHGFHVHQFGDCSGDAAKTAGTHFNFRGSSENPPKDIDRITGNLGEIVAGDTGDARVDVTIPTARIDGRFGIVGRSVIVHAKGNDPSKPPIGGAGARIACGVIGIADGTM